MTYTQFQLHSRNLILIDIENLSGTPVPTASEVESVIALLRSHLPRYDDDQKVVACSHHAAPIVSFAFPAARRLWRSGRNGADLALLEVLENERIAQRYQRVTICSGDGIFSGVTSALGAAGTEVTVVALAGSLAARLEIAAARVLLISPDPGRLAVGGSL